MLDLTHFGSSPGIFGRDQLREKAVIKLGDMQKDLQAAFYFAEEKTKYLQEWLKLCQEEFSVFVGPAIGTSISRFMQFAEELLAEIAGRRDSIMKEVFGIDQRVEIIDEDAKPSRLIERLNSEMQVNRILTLVGRRFSELVFLLRKIHALVVNKFLPKVFGGKRSPFVIH